MVKALRDKKTYYLLPILLLLLGELYVFIPKTFLLALGLGILAIVLSVKGLASKRGNLNWPFFVYFPLIFFASSSLYATLVPNFYLVQALLLLNAAFTYIYYRNLYYFFRYEAPDRADEIDTFLMTASVLSLFFLASAMYGLPVFIGWNFWLLFIVFIFASMPLFFQPFILGSLNLKNNWPVFLSSIVIFSELAAVLYLLPFGFNVLALMAAIFFYISLLILRLLVRNRFSGKILRFPLFSSLIIIIILLLTTRWF
jgi:hypothetical protein